MVVDDRMFGRVSGTQENSCRYHPQQKYTHTIDLSKPNKVQKGFGLEMFRINKLKS